jgi:hypothetical protein
MDRRATPAFALVLFAILVAACATPQTERVRTNPNLLTQEEITATQASNLYEAVSHLRPRWLTVRSQRSFGSGTEIVVYQGQTYLGDIHVLRQLGLTAAASLQYLDGPTASASLPGLGGRHVEGAIILHTASGRRF